MTTVIRALLIALHAAIVGSASYAQEENRRPPLPTQLKDVIAEWHYDDDGRILAVEFGNGGKAGDRHARNSDLEALAALPDLKSIMLDPAVTTNDSLKSLKELSGVKTLRLPQCRVTEDGIAHLKPLKTIVVLDLNDTDIGDDAMKIISAMPDLEYLDIAETGISDVGLSKLFGHSKLQTLKIGSGSGGQEGRITDTSIATIGSLKNLRECDFSSTAMFDVRALRKALPECKFVPPADWENALLNRPSSGR